MEAMTKDLWVFIETKSDGSAKNVGLELLNPGRRLADKQGGALVAVVIGNHVGEAVKACAAHDADKVLVVEGPEYENYTTDAYVNAMYHLVTKFGPTTLMIGATPNGRDFGPRLSCRLKTGLTADCTSLDIDEQSGNIAWTRPAFGGNLMATILCSDTRPQIGTVRSGVFKKAAEVAPHAEIIKEDYHVAPEDIRTKLLRVIHDAAEEIDKEERFPEETVRQMAEKGMLGIPSPRNTEAPAWTTCPMPSVWRSCARSAPLPASSSLSTPPLAPIPFTSSARRNRSRSIWSLWPAVRSWALSA